MSVERLVPGGGLQITDADGDSLTVERAARVRAVVIVRTPEDGVLVDVEDGLALLSFLADALGVERYLPAPVTVELLPDSTIRRPGGES